VFLDECIRKGGTYSAPQRRELKSAIEPGRRRRDGSGQQVDEPDYAKDCRKWKRQTMLPLSCLYGGMGRLRVIVVLEMFAARAVLKDEWPTTRLLQTAKSSWTFWLPRLVVLADVAAE